MNFLSPFNPVTKWLTLGLLGLVLTLSGILFFQHRTIASLEERLGAQNELVAQAKTDVATSNAQVESLKAQADDITNAATALVEKARAESKSYIVKSDEVLQRPQTGDSCKSANDLLNESIGR